MRIRNNLHHHRGGIPSTDGNNQDDVDIKLYRQQIWTSTSMIQQKASNPEIAMEPVSRRRLDAKTTAEGSG